MRWYIFLGFLRRNTTPMTWTEPFASRVELRRSRRPPWNSPWTASSLRMTTSLRPRISSSSYWNASRWMERLATWEIRSASTGRRPRSMSLLSLLSPSVTWSIWARSTWRPSNCETSCVSLPLTRPPTRCATSTSMMRRMRKSKQLDVYQQTAPMTVHDRQCYTAGRRKHGSGFPGFWIVDLLWRILRSLCPICFAMLIL